VSRIRSPFIETSMPSTITAAPPAADEYAAWYAGYVAAVGDADPVAILSDQRSVVERELAGLDETRALHRYAPGKWSVKEVLGHVTDAERIFAYRLLRIARGDATPLPGFEENAYVAAAGFDARPMADVAAEWRAVREATLALLGTLDAAALERRGTASGYPVSARALVWIIAGHPAHHLSVLRERYGVAGV
jgi:uncharacterized damage-inducible protein DinB